MSQTNKNSDDENDNWSPPVAEKFVFNEPTSETVIDYFEKCAVYKAQLGTQVAQVIKQPLVPINTRTSNCFSQNQSELNSMMRSVHEKMREKISDKVVDIDKWEIYLIIAQLHLEIFKNSLAIQQYEKEIEALQLRVVVLRKAAIEQLQKQNQNKN